MPQPIFNQQLHPDTMGLIARTTNQISAPVLEAIDEFVRWCYLNGLRDQTGASHTIQSCFISCSTTLTKLWFRSGESASLSPLGTPTYFATTGINVLAGTREARTHNANLLSVNDCSFFFHNLSNAGNRDFFGVQASLTSRILIHPQWIDDNNIYFDVGNNTTGRISAFNGTDSRGLIIGTKLNAAQILYQRGVQIAQNLSAPTTGLTLPASAIAGMGRSGTDVVTARNIGGFGTGRAIPAAQISGFTTMWNAIQTALGR